jgi:PAS domain S-box-containing protein
MDDLGPDPEVLASRLEKEATLQVEVKGRFGVIPNFFRLTPEHAEITDYLWRFACFAYLDNPLPSLFKERLFVYLSRFCEVRYCILRHLGFLVGLGHASGDPQTQPQSVEEVVRLLQTPLAYGSQLRDHLIRYAHQNEPLQDLPKPGTPLETAIFAFASHAFLHTGDAGRCLDTLKRLLGESRYERLSLFLAFVQTAHFWTKIHPELEIEEDVKGLLSTNQSLAECVLNDPEARSGELSSRLLDELASLREKTQNQEALSLQHEQLLQAHRVSRERERNFAERLRLVVENSRDYAIFSTDLDRRVTSWNVGAKAILGYTEAEILGKVADVIFAPEDREAGVPEVEAQTALAQGRALDERQHTRKDGSRFWGSGVLTVIHDTVNKSVGFIKILRDQTEARTTRQELESSRQELMVALRETERARTEAEAAVRTKDRFLALLSHELRTPLAPVLFATEMLSGCSDLPSNMLEAVSMIRRNVELEAHFIDELLDLTRISQGNLRCERVIVDLHEVVRSAVKVCEPDIVSKQQLLKVELDVGEYRVTGDFTRLQQVFWNLLKNSSKFTPKSGAIHVCSRREGLTWIIVEISDNGTGIDEDALTRIFEPFEQAEASVQAKFGGLGLGLAICKAVVAAHDGTISCSSRGPGQGATFGVKLPLLISGAANESVSNKSSDGIRQATMAEKDGMENDIIPTSRSIASST